MFEMIGLLIATAIFFLLSLGAGLVYAGIAFLILRKQPRGRKSLLLLATAIPVCSAAYMWLCVASLPGESLFGDVSEPLPNGFVLKALGKMPEYGHIERQNGDFASDGVRGDIDKIAVKGPLVAGRYCQTCDSAFVQSKAAYFILDTRNSTATEYDDLPSFEAAFHSNAPLVENQFFRSREARYVLQQRMDRAFMFTPPLALTVVYFAYLLRHRGRESSRPVGNLY